MEVTKPKVNVKRFSRSKTEEPSELPIIEKKTKGKKKVSIVVEEPLEVTEPIIAETKTEEIPETFEIDDNFLAELNNSNYQKEQEEEQQKEEKLKQNKELEKERIKQEKEHEKLIKQIEKDSSKQERTNKIKINSDNDLYSDTPTEIQGKDKLLLIHKIKQYKNLFPDELKTYKIKPNASINELKAYIDDMDIILTTSNVDQFLTDSILQCIKLIEIPTSKTKNFNITGLSDLLKANIQFHQLCKKLYLKYGCFDKIPEEYQLIILVSTTAYVCKNKNCNKSELDAYLNEKIEIK
jgi:hypothetical protein